MLSWKVGLDVSGGEGSLPLTAASFHLLMYDSCAVMFRIYDIDGDGYISEKDVCLLSRALQWVYNHFKYTV